MEFWNAGNYAVYHIWNRFDRRACILSCNYCAGAERIAEIKKDSDSPNRIPPRPQTNEFKIPPRARDGKTFSTDLTQKEMLEKIIKQNQKIINQNKIIIEELKKVNKWLTE